jgi:hypothetical protein
MNAFHDHVANYLKARRALGFKLTYPELVLHQFASYLEAAGARTITVELAVEFAGLPKAVTPIHLSSLVATSGSSAMRCSIGRRPSSTNGVGRVNVGDVTITTSRAACGVVRAMTRVSSLG